MNELLKTLKFADLYGPAVIFEMLKKQFKNVSFREKSIPSDGSRSFRVDQLKPSEDVQIKKSIIHKNGEITIQTTAGYLRFF